jgi:hypothetical protein
VNITYYSITKITLLVNFVNLMLESERIRQKLLWTGCRIIQRRIYTQLPLPKGLHLKVYAKLGSKDMK